MVNVRVNLGSDAVCTVTSKCTAKSQYSLPLYITKTAQFC
jgi:hypothetical protein